MQALDDQCLDQDLCCVPCEDRPDPTDVEEGKSAGSGHSSDVGGTGQSVPGIMPRFLAVSEGDTLTSSTVTERSMQVSVFSRDEEEFSFTKFEFEVMCSCPSGDVCQTFRDARCNVSFAGGWGEKRGTVDCHLQLMVMVVFLLS